MGSLHATGELSSAQAGLGQCLIQNSRNRPIGPWKSSQSAPSPFSEGATDRASPAVELNQFRPRYRRVEPILYRIARCDHGTAGAECGQRLEWKVEPMFKNMTWVGALLIGIAIGTGVLAFRVWERTESMRHSCEGANGQFEVRVTWDYGPMLFTRCGLGHQSEPATADPP